MTFVLRPEEWPYTPEYTRACERLMERMGVAEEDRASLMGILTRLHGAPLTHLYAIEFIACAPANRPKTEG